jgi:hypothetical protein
VYGALLGILAFLGFVRKEGTELTFVVDVEPAAAGHQTEA